MIAEANGAWQLIDGRNRLAACKMAGMTPAYLVLTTDPTAYILSANVHRRHPPTTWTTYFEYFE